MSAAAEYFPFDEPAADIIASDAFCETMYSINAGSHISRQLAHDALLEVLRNETDSRDTRLGALLMGSMRIATPGMIAGFADAVSSYESIDLTGNKQSVKHDDSEVIVGCAGSGKKGRKTFNISTAAMVVAAATGGTVLKAGSKAASSVTGSTDVLALHGFAVPETNDDATTLLQATNFGYYSIEHTVPAFDERYGNRFFAPHALSFVLPALLIPVGVDRLMYGYAGPDVDLSMQALQAIGYTSALVCTNTKDGLHYIDEMASNGTTVLSGIQDGVPGEKRAFKIASYLGLRGQAGPDIDSRLTKTGQSELFTDVIDGKFPDSIAENTVCINAATMLYLGGQFTDPKNAFWAAKSTLRDGLAKDKLADIVTASNDIAGS